MTTSSLRARRARVAHLPPPTPGLRLRMTYEEYLAWAPDNVFAEWADGEVEIAMPATHLHQRVIMLFSVLLDLFVRGRGLGAVLTGPFEVKLWPDGGPAREPDIIYVRADRHDAVGPNCFAGGPDLAAEVISGDSIRRDRETKWEEYARAGVQEYWVIDPRPGVRRREAVLVHRLDPTRGAYAPAEEVHADGVVRSSVVPGFWIRAEWLWQTPEPDSLILLQEILRYPDGPDGPEAPAGLTVLPWSAPLLQQGRAEGKTQDILVVLRERFGSVPPLVEQRVQATQDLAHLERLLIQALRVSDPLDLLTNLD